MALLPPRSSSKPPKLNKDDDSRHSSIPQHKDYVIKGPRPGFSRAVSKVGTVIAGSLLQDSTRRYVNSQKPLNKSQKSYCHC